jgi:SAM-dependent methyltransferase
MTAFKSTAAYYDALANPARRIEREGPFLTGLLARAPGPRVLELACGTGIHAWFLAEQGADVTACDLSAEMIAYARGARPHPGVAFETADMRDPPGGTWDAALCIGNSLCLLTGEEDLGAMFAAVSERLAPGGRFLAQVLNYASPALAEPRHRIEEVYVDDTPVVAVKSLVPRDGYTLLTLAFFAGWPETALHTAAEATLLRNWSIGQLETAAGNAGLVLANCNGSLDGSPFNPETSGDLVTEWEKPA